MPRHVLGAGEARLVSIAEATSIQLAYSVLQAAAICGLGESAIRAELKAGRMKRRYYNSKPVILHDDLLEWLLNLPTTKAPED